MKQEKHAHDMLMMNDGVEVMLEAWGSKQISIFYVFIYILCMCCTLKFILSFLLFI